MKKLYQKIVEKLKNYQYNHLNVRLIIFVIALCVLGINVIASARPGEGFDEKQIFGLVLGISVMVVIALFDYHFILKFYWLIYLFNIGFLLAVRLIGEEVKGAQRWIKVAGIQLQPSEFAKIFIILVLAAIISKYSNKINSFKVIVFIGIVFAIPLFLILKQPDLSTSIVICGVFCFIMYSGGISYKIILGAFGIGAVAATVLVYLLLQPDQKILEEYQYNRIVGFYDEDNEVAERINYQQQNSIIAIGTGGLWGKGLNNDSEDSVKNGNYISEPQTDFIFTIVGEELGFMGTMSVVVLLFLICVECFYVGAHAPDIMGKVICCGVGGLIAVQSFINMAVTTRLIPNTGLPLPFVSYGLSSLISLFMGLGFVLNVGLQHKKLL